MLKDKFWIGLIIGAISAILLVGAGLYTFRGVIGQINFTGESKIPVLPDQTASQASKLAMTEARRLVETDDKRDFEFAKKGFIANREDPLIRNAKGRVISDLRSYDFLKGEAPDTVNPSLWRQAKILTQQGLYKIADKIYQVRGFDISVVSFIDAGEGWIVVDPLTVVESAKAAMDLVTMHAGKKPVLAVIYSHTHADHFGGVLGITSREDVASGKVSIIAPEGFLKHAITENVIVGPAMSRRARFQIGDTLNRGAKGEVTSGLGPGIPRGKISFIPPTQTITKTGQEITIGNIKLVFQVTPGTEAPAEMNFYLPQFKAVFMAENANLCMHNLLPARGTLVRDAKAWADYLTESIRMFGDKSDLMFAAHGVPRFGQDEIIDFLTKHRDAYKFLHDQSVRMMNNGLTGPEIAEVLKLPDILAKQWYNRGYYGTLSHNSKAVYQRYLGWYDANPANLWPLPPKPASKRYVEDMGGPQKVIERAKTATDKGEYRWAAMLLNHVVFADDTNTSAKNLLADVYTQLGFQCEAGTWRNIYLTGAQELRNGVQKRPLDMKSIDLILATPTGLFLDFAAGRVDPDKAIEMPFKLNLEVIDRKEQYLITVQNGVLIHEEGIVDPEAGATVKCTFQDLLLTLIAKIPISLKTLKGDILIEGEKNLYQAFADIIEPLDVNFPIVTP